jgi:acetyl/propionyl-CoA carboxylase alpha subunit
VLVYEEPAGPGIRVESGIEAGNTISIYYDPMLAKIVARGRDREEARRRLVAALRDTVILGVTTNVPYLRRVLESEAVAAGDIDTGLLERWSPPPPPPPGERVFAAAARAFASTSGGLSGGKGSGPSHPDPFAAGAFRVLA